MSMKVLLVVATGAHQGKVIPITGPQFLIGRDPQCHLRPASQAVSKQHCGVMIRDGKVYLKDYGSTNGTVVNDAIVQGEERQLTNNDSVKVGPLDFTIRIEAATAPPDGTPLPDMNPEARAALAAVKAATAGTPPKPSAGTPTPTPKAPPAKPSTGSKESPALKPGSKESAALKTGPKESPAPPTAAAPDTPASTDEEHDRIAAMLLGLADGDVPQGSTVVDMPAVTAGANPGDQSAAAKLDEKDAKKMPTREDTSSAASEILRKYMRRPK
jgi:predicted component of type VI protein secretion system